jgi:hypothetical protein
MKIFLALSIASPAIAQQPFYTISLRDGENLPLASVTWIGLKTCEALFKHVTLLAESERVGIAGRVAFAP